MTKGQLMASIITKLRGKQKRYTIESIVNAVLPNEYTTGDIEFVKDAIFSLSQINALKETTNNEKHEDDVVFYFTVSVFYRQHLNAAPQTESIKECYQTLFPNGYQKAEQITMFHETN